MTLDLTLSCYVLCYSFSSVNISSSVSVCNKRYIKLCVRHAAHCLSNILTAVVHLPRLCSVSAPLLLSAARGHMDMLRCRCRLAISSPSPRHLNDHQRLCELPTCHVVCWRFPRSASMSMALRDVFLDIFNGCL